MAEKMKSFLKKIFIENWQRKLVALILAIITWWAVNHSLTITKTISNIPVQIINIPQGKTIIGIDSNGSLNKTINLALSGNKHLLEQLSEEDLKVVINANDQASINSFLITENNVISTNPNIKIKKNIKQVKPQYFSVQFSNLVTDKIPVNVISPHGKSPRDYSMITIWPNKFLVNVSGPEEIINKLKTSTIRLSFDLSKISRKELNALYSQKKGNSDLISYYIPTSWKKIEIPEISSMPIEIDDPLINMLRIDFIKEDALPINTKIPIQLFYSLSASNKYNPKTISLQTNNFIKLNNNIPVVSVPLYSKGVSKIFLDVVKDMMEIIISIDPSNNKFHWNVQAILPMELEEKYLAKFLQEEKEYLSHIKIDFQEDYIRNSFRKFLHRLKLWLSADEKLDLNIKLENNQVVVKPYKK